jgi:hypothetical protein
VNGALYNMVWGKRRIFGPKRCSTPVVDRIPLFFSVRDADAKSCHTPRLMFLFNSR